VYETGSLGNATAFPIFVLWLYGALVLGGRRSGYIIMFLGSLLGCVVPLVHMRGKDLGGAVANHADFFFVSTVITIGVTALLSVILSVQDYGACGVDRSRPTARATSTCRLRGTPARAPRHHEVDVIRGRIDHALVGVVRGELATMVIPVSHEVMDHVDHAGIPLLAGRPPEVEHLIEARRDQTRTGRAILVERPQQLVLLQHWECVRGLPLAEDPLEPDALGCHDVSQQFARPSLGVGLRMDELHPSPIRPEGLVEEKVQFSDQGCLRRRGNAIECRAHVISRGIRVRCLGGGS